MAETAALIVGALACATDLRGARIPNALTLSAIVAALTFHALAPAGVGLAAAGLGLLVGLLVFFPFFALGAMGAGDVKLMAALGAWLGWHAAINVALFGAVAGGVLAVVVALWHGYLRTALGNVKTLLFHWWLTGVQAVARADARRRQGAAPPVRAADHGGPGGDVMATLNLRRLCRSERGAELIEMAIVTPLLLLLVMGIVDFGFMFQRFVVLTNAAVEGARVATLPGYSEADASARAQAYATNGGVPGIGDCVTAPAVALPGAGGGTWPGVQVHRARTSTRLQYLAPIATLVGGTMAANVTLTARSTMRRQIAAS